MKKAIVIYSGGMDSFTLLHHAKKHTLPFALSFDYGQRHKKELTMARAVCATNNVPHQVVDITNCSVLMQGSSLTSDIAVPEGHYAIESMKQTVVPNRNMIMLSLAVAYAVSINADAVYCGAHAGDHDIYPDCRAEFFEALNQVTAIANYHPVSIKVPFIELDKGQILKHGKEHLGLRQDDYLWTWTCYNGQMKACGKCGSCVERQEGFESIGWTDPVEYEDREFWKGQM